MAFTGRRLAYAAVASVLLLAVLLLLRIGGPPPTTDGPLHNTDDLLRRRLRLCRSLQGQDDPDGIQRRARQEVDLVASETRRVEKQLSGIMPGGRRAPPA